MKLMKLLLLFLTLINITFQNRYKNPDIDSVEVYPDELTPIDHFEVPQFPEWNIQDNTSTASYKAKLLKEQLPLFHHPVGTYYKDELPYYGPKITYNSIPDPSEEDDKYITPITIGHPTLYHKNSTELQLELNELDRQLTHLLLFSDEPKYLNKDSHNQKVYDKFPLAYYDPTQEETSRRIKQLRDKILEIKKELHMKPEIHYDITIQNKTFPISAEDVVNHYEESFINYKNDSIKHSNVINGNYTNLHDVYKLRKAHSFEHKNILDQSISLINGKMKLKLDKENDKKDKEDKDKQSIPNLIKKAENSIKDIKKINTNTNNDSENNEIDDEESLNDGESMSMTNNIKNKPQIKSNTTPSATVVNKSLRVTSNQPNNNAKNNIKNVNNGNKSNKSNKNIDKDKVDLVTEEDNSNDIMDGIEDLLV